MVSAVCLKLRKSRWAIGIAMALVSVAAGGCDDTGNPFAISLKPFYTKTDLETDLRLIGTWKDPDGDCSFTFEEGKEKEYSVVVKERVGEQESSGEFEAHLMRLGGWWFIDFFPKAMEGGNEFYRVHFLRGHSLARFALGQDTMQLAFLDASWLSARIEEKSVDTPHETADGSLLLTATTEELQGLAYRYANDDKAFAEPLSMKRIPVEEEGL